MNDEHMSNRVRVEHQPERLWDWMRGSLSSEVVKVQSSGGDMIQLTAKLRAFLGRNFRLLISEKHVLW